MTAGDASTLKEQVWQLLGKNPLLTAKPICTLLRLVYSRHGGYVRNLKSMWKRHLRIGLGSRRPNWHHWHGRIVVDAHLGVSREEAVKKGWQETRAKNHYLLWKDALGRLEWHLNGTVKVWVRKPVTEGKKLQLLASAFVQTWLITDIKAFSKWAETLRQTRVHCAVDTGVRLPYFRIDLWKESNGIEIVGGDSTHPTCIEAKLKVPEWAEEFRQKANVMFDVSQKSFEQFTGFLKTLSTPRQPPKNDKMVV